VEVLIELLLCDIMGKMRRQPMSKTSKGRIRSNSGKGPKPARRSRHSNKHRPKLKPVEVPKSSIHSWKRNLGPLIRYYANSHEVEAEAAEREVESIYFASGCSEEATKIAIVRRIGGTQVKLEDAGQNKEWVRIHMVVEGDVGAAGKMDGDVYAPGDSGGIRLNLEEREGDGPAHARDSWMNAVVPRWAEGRSYYIEVENNSALNFSCKMRIDNEVVAKNVPIPPHSCRTIKPTFRYYGSHNWVLMKPERVKLRPGGEVPDRRTSGPRAVPKKRNRRENGVRPDYQGRRLDEHEYPDATAYGWKFTGSLASSGVEFFEQRTNNGGRVRLDFYYATGAVVTILDHPTTGFHPLYRGRASPDLYKQILLNPRMQRGGDDGQAADRSASAMEGVEPVGADDGTMDADDGAMDADDGATDRKTAGDAFCEKIPEGAFREEGHSLRRSEMLKLEGDGLYRAWERAQQVEYARIQADFYVAEPTRMRGPRPRSRARGPSRRTALPPMAPVVDLRATERVGLSTKFCPAAPAPHTSKSRVRMEPIGGPPTFVCKLYYRTEAVDDASEDAPGGAEDGEDARPVAERLRENMPLEEYRNEKLEQMDADRRGRIFSDGDDARIKLERFRSLVESATTTKAVDGPIKMYFDWIQTEH